MREKKPEKQPILPPAPISWVDSDPPKGSRGYSTTRKAYHRVWSDGRLGPRE